MNYRQKGINIRVNTNEKKILKAKAKKCKLSLSAYLRKCGLNQKIIEIPNDKFKTIYLKISELKYKIDSLNKEQIINELEDIETDFRRLYSGEDINGDNENMGG